MTEMEACASELSSIGGLPSCSGLYNEVVCQQLFLRFELLALYNPYGDILSYRCVLRMLFTDFRLNRFFF